MKGLEECLNIIIDAETLLKATRERLRCLEQFPAIFARFDTDALFSIFKHLKAPKDVLYCSRVCQLWKHTIEKYKDNLTTNTDDYCELYLKLGTKWPDAPLYITSMSDRTRLFMQLMQGSREYWSILRDLVIRKENLVFTECNRTTRVNIYITILLCKFTADITIVFPSAFNYIKFLPGQMDPRIVERMVIGTGPNVDKRITCSRVFITPVKEEETGKK